MCSRKSSMTSAAAGHLSEGQKQLARRASLMSLECEKLEAKAVAGEEIDLEAFGKLSDRIGRAFQRLGLKRASRDVTPMTLKDYVRLHDEAKREAAE
jgi:hypothetical protein